MMTNALVDQCPVQKGIVHKEFVHPGQTVNAAFCAEILKRLRENVRKEANRSVAEQHMAAPT